MASPHGVGCGCRVRSGLIPFVAALHFSPTIPELSSYPVDRSTSSETGGDDGRAEDERTVCVIRWTASSSPTGGERVTGASMSQFHELAQYYDAINDRKDYRVESERLEAIARRYGRPAGATWLDVGCGTGRHLEFLRRHHAVIGVDLSPEMLRIARRRVPGVRLLRGDMRTFRLGRQFDVVSCLFSAIGHLASVRDVQKTFDNFARHLKPGGVAIVEPWIERSAFHPGMVFLQTYDGPSLKIARASFSSRRGRHSMIHYHFLIGEPRRKVRYFELVDDGLLLTRGELHALLKRSGLRPHFLTRGFTTGRGLFVGVKRSAAERERNEF